MAKAIPALVLVFRIFTLVACVVSGLLLALDNFTDDGEKVRFYDFISFRYVLAFSIHKHIHKLKIMDYGLIFELGV